MKLLWHMPTLRRATCGLSNRARRLAVELRSRGHDTTFVVARDKTDLSDLIVDGFPVRFLDVERRDPLHWSLQARERQRFTRKVITAVNDISHDLFVTCQPEAVTAYRAMSNRLSSGHEQSGRIGSHTPIIFVCGGTTILHDAADSKRDNASRGVSHRIALGIDRRLKRRIERDAFEDADLCIFDSDSTRRRVIDMYAVDPTKCHAIHGAVDCERFAPVAADERRRARKLLEISPDAFVVAWTGRLSPEKNLPTLIRAIYQCDSPRFRLVIAGDGPERSSLELLNRELIARASASSQDDPTADANRVRFLGALDDVRPALRAADAFVFPSVSESLGLSLIEAMSCGLPCVALAADERTIRNASTEILQSGDCGLLVPRNDSADFAMAIERLANDAELRAMLAARARRRAVERYDWRNAGVAFDQLISSPFCRSNQLTMTQSAIRSTEPVRA